MEELLRIFFVETIKLFEDKLSVVCSLQSLSFVSIGKSRWPPPQDIVYQSSVLEKCFYNLLC